MHRLSVNAYSEFYRRYEPRFREMIEKYQEHALNVRTNSKWEKVFSEKACEIYTTKVEGKEFGGNDAALGIETIDTELSPLSFLVFWKQAVREDEIKRAVNMDYYDGEVLHEFGDCYIAHVKVKVKNMIVRDRELYIVGEAKYDSKLDRLYVFAGSADTGENLELFPKKTGTKCVRGILYCMMWKITKPSPFKLKLEYLNHSNAGGLIGSRLGNLKTSEKGKRVQRYAAEFQKWSKKFGIENLKKIEERLKERVKEEEEKAKKEPEVQPVDAKVFWGLEPEKLKEIMKVQQIEKMMKENEGRMKGLKDMFEQGMKNLKERFEDLKKENENANGEEN